MREYPEIEVEVDISDRPVNLQEDGYDVAIRTGALSNSSLIAKRLAPDRHIDRRARRPISPATGARCGPKIWPITTAWCSASRWQWSFSKNGTEAQRARGGPLRSNNGELLCHAALDGLGLIRTCELEVLTSSSSGKLVQVLADFEVTTNAAVWALYPSAKHVLPRMRVLLDFLANWFREAGNERAGSRGRDAGRRGRRDHGAAAPRCSCAARWPSGRLRLARRSSMRRTATTAAPCGEIFAAGVAPPVPAGVRIDRAAGFHLREQHDQAIGIGPFGIPPSRAKLSPA